MTRFIAAVAVAVLLALPTLAQELESLGGVRLRFDEPGARGAAMGGASEALDDLFTVATNPAALARQKQRAIAIEGRSTTDTTDYVSGGDVGAFTYSSFDVDSTGLRSAMVVLPGRRANWALYYDEPLSATHNAQVVPLPPFDVIKLGVRGNDLVPYDDCVKPDGPSDCTVVAFVGIPLVSPVSTNLHLRRYGASAATTLGARVALGASVQYAQLDQDTRYAFGAGQTTRDGRLTWNAGTQIDLTKAVRLGASYRSGATFDGERTLMAIDGIQRFEGGFVTPSSYAAGLAADLTPSLTVAVDAVRMNYSEMTDALPGDRSDPNILLLTMPDVTELRAGAEYRLATRVPVALRAGWWREPAHRAQAGGGFPGMAVLMNKLNLLDADENHVTAGIGIGDRVRFDAAIDRSENTSRASVGVATTF